MAPHWTGLLIVAILLLLLFGGRGKISSLMGEVGKGITSFKKGVADGSKDDEPDTTSTAADPALADGTAARDVTPEAAKKDKV